MLNLLNKEKKSFKVLFPLFTMIPDGLFYKSMRPKMIGMHTLLLKQIKLGGRKIKPAKMNYAIIRGDYTGILRIEE